MIVQQTKIQSFLKKNIFQQFAKFGFTGVIVTIYGIISYYILLERLGLPLYPVYVVVYFIGVGLSYLINSKYTFKESYKVKDSVKYFMSYTASLSLGLLILYSFDSLLPDVSDFYLTIIVIPFRFMITFLLLKVFIYKK